MNRSILMILLGALAQPVVAQDAVHPKFDQDWTFRLGAAVVDTRPVIGLSADGFEPVDLIDLRREGYDTEATSFMGAFDWNITERWSLDFQYYRDRVSGTRGTDRDYEWGDIEIPAGSGLTVDFATDFYILRGTYDFLRGRSYKVGAGIGIYALDVSSALSARLGDQTLGSESEDLLAPLPTLSAYAEWALDRHWLINVAGAWLSAEYGDWDGEVWAARAAAEYWFDANWGLGIGYQVIDVELIHNDDPFDYLGSFDWTGPTIYLTAGF